MSRNKADPDLKRQVCKRFIWMIENGLGMTSASAARALGYANATTIQKVKRCETVPDVLRLVQLANLKTASGLRPNLHWLITGESTPLLEEGIEPSRSFSSAINLLRQLEPYKREALIQLLS